MSEKSANSQSHESRFRFNIHVDYTENYSIRHCICIFFVLRFSSNDNDDSDVCSKNFHQINACIWLPTFLYVEWTNDSRWTWENRFRQDRLKVYKITNDCRWGRVQLRQPWIGKWMKIYETKKRWKEKDRKNMEKHKIMFERVLLCDSSNIRVASCAPQQSGEETRASWSLSEYLT